ncbi:MAG: carboxypeptidase regulatory-like domain-containing protein [Candidatus Solibacter sp.]
MTTKQRLMLVGFALLAPALCFPQTQPVATGSIRGEVFTKGDDGQRALVPGMHITLRGSATRETDSDAYGRYSFDKVPAGVYSVEANAQGLNGQLAVAVQAGQVSAAPLELSVSAVTTSVTVAATDTAVAVASSSDSAQSTIIAQSTVESAPNRTEHVDSLLPLVPGVVRGPDGRINMKGARSAQGGWLLNSANVTDPATGNEAINLPIDVVSSVQVISSPYNPEYGKFTGAISSVETRTGNLDAFHFSVQNLLPRLRNRDGAIVGLESVTPRATVTGPLLKNRIAFTQSLEYRFIRTPVESLPPLERDTKSESFNSYTQVDIKLNDRQTASVSLALFPEKRAYLGLNTFSPQSATPDLHQRGYETSMQHHYVIGSGALLSSRFSYEKFDADVLPNSTDPYRLLVETTEGGFFDRQGRRSDRIESQEIYQAEPKRWFGTHVLKVGGEFSRSSYDGRQEFLPVEIVGTAGDSLQRIEFGAPTRFAVHQNEFAWFVGDQWTLRPRVKFDLGLRFDHDSVTDSTHTAPRAGFAIALTRDQRTLLRAGAGIFYDRVPLNAPAFPQFPSRTIVELDPAGQALSSTAYPNRISGSIHNPRSGAFNVELDRELRSNLLLRASYQQRNTRSNFVVAPGFVTGGSSLLLSNGGRDSYQELQVTGVYQTRRYTVNASYVRSKAHGDLNDFSQFFGNNPQAVIQPNSRSRLGFDAPNRFLTWGEIALPGKFTLMPVLDVHTGFPYSVVNQRREFVGPRNDLRFRSFSSLDAQILKQIHLPFLGKDRKAKVGFGVFNLLNHFDPRDVQNDLDSNRYGAFFNGTPRAFRGKFVVGF